MQKDGDWLAGAVGVSPVTMRQHFMRGVTPSRPTLLLMAHVLGCQLSDLVYEEELETEEPPPNAA